MDPAAKTRFLRIDSMLKMSHDFEDAFIHSAWVSQTQRILAGVVSPEEIESRLRFKSSPFLLLEIRRQYFIHDAMDQVVLYLIENKQKRSEQTKPTNQPKSSERSVPI